MAAITKLGLTATPFSQLNDGRYDGKTVANAFQEAILVFQFDIWREGYAGAVVQIFKEGTTTYASLYTNINLSEAADNPQVLLTQELNGRTFGKFTESIYTPDSYYLVINGIESSGVNGQVLRTLSGEEADDAEVTSNQGGIERTLAERAADTIHVLDFGLFTEVDGSTTQNTTTLTAALGVASSANGGEVILPAGTFKVSAFNLPANVILRGQGINATIIQSIEADSVCTITGADAGMKDMTLDGISLEAGSIGVYGVGLNRVHFDDVIIKRFESGVQFRGGTDHHYHNLFVQNCGTCLDLRGDMDASDSSDGSSFTDLTWDGGSVTESTSYGLRLRNVDAACENLVIRDVNFTDNIGTAALYIQGAEQIVFEDLICSGNTLRHLLTENVTLNEVEALDFRSCQFTASEIKLGGACKDVVFDRTILDGALSINANNPTYAIMFRDNREASTVTQTGNTDKISRWTSTDFGVYRGQTTASATTATVFKRQLDPGEIVHMEITASAVHNSSAVWFSEKMTAAVYCPGAQISFDGQTANFTLGNTLTGTTSRATGALQAQTDAGATGLLTLIRVVAGATTGNVFQDNEAITGSGGGAAVVDGAISYQAAVLKAPLQIDHYVMQPSTATAINIDVTTSNREVHVKALGPTTGTMDWNIMVRLNSRK